MPKITKGFTLMELLTVIIIVGILGALAIPNYMRAQRRSYSAEAWANLSALLEAEKIYYVDNGYAWTTNIALLPVDNPNSRIGYGAKFSYLIQIPVANTVSISADAAGVPAGSGRIPNVGWWVLFIQCADCMQTNEAITRQECNPFPGCDQVGG